MGRGTRKGMVMAMTKGKMGRRQALSLSMKALPPLRLHPHPLAKKLVN